MSKLTGNTYQIKLPNYTDREIINWFESKANENTLAEEIIALVYDALNNSDGTFKINESLQIEPENNQSQQYLDDLFNNLYNWEESKNELLQEGVKKAKKKMLSV